MWSNILGQTRVKRILQSALEHEKLPGAYLFYGPEGTGKDQAAFELAKAINCLNFDSQRGPCDECANCVSIDNFTSPLVTYVYALAKDVEDVDSSSGNTKDEELEVIREQLALKANDHYHNLEIPRAVSIQIGQIRQLRLALTRSLTAGTRRTVIVSEADMMNQQAQNAFLKTLEEPHPNTLIILTSSNVNRLYPTILSRCQDIRFDTLTPEEITEALIERDELPKEQAAFLARLANGSYSQARTMIGEDIHEMRKEIVSFLRMGLSRSRKQAVNEIDVFLPKSGGAYLEKRVAVENRLLLLSLWLRDALALATNADDHIINIDQQEDLKRFVAKFGKPDGIISAIRAVERAQSLARQQLMLRPVMLDLVMNLEQALVV